MPTTLINGNNSLIALITGSYPGLSTPQIIGPVNTTDRLSQGNFVVLYRGREDFMPMLPLYIKATFYAKLAFVLLKASFYAGYFRIKCPCESLTACAILYGRYTKGKFYANCFN